MQAADTQSTQLTSLQKNTPVAPEDVQAEGREFYGPPYEGPLSSRYRDGKTEALG